MGKGHKFFMILVAASFGLSLYLKTPKEETRLVEASVYQTEKLNQLGFDLKDSVRPVNRGEFVIQLYTYKTCKGALALLALNKNEEGAAILAHYLKRPLNDIKYVYNAGVYDTFPAFQYWLDSVLPWQKASYVYAMKEFGGCQLIEKTDWSQI